MLFHFLHVAVQGPLLQELTQREELLRDVFQITLLVLLQLEEQQQEVGVEEEAEEEPLLLEEEQNKHVR